MAFQFKRDRSENLTLTLAGDIDLEVTPDIKAQLTSQLADAASLTIDASSVSYLDSSGVSILVIAMQSCKQKQINLSVSRVSEEAVRVLQLAKLDKILPIGEISGPAHLVDVDVFSEVGSGDSEIAAEVEAGEADAPHSDDDLIAALSSGDMGGDADGDMGGDMSSAPSADSAQTAQPTQDSAADTAPADISMTPEPETPQPAAQPAAEPAPQVTPQVTPEAAPQPAPAQPSQPSGSDDEAGSGGSGGPGGSGGGSFTPGTFG